MVLAESALRQLYDDGQTAWPEVSLSFEAYQQYLAAQSQPLLATHPDFFLACACAQGVPEALAVFDREFLAPVPGLIARLDPSPATAAEVCQRLRVKLLL